MTQIDHALIGRQPILDRAGKLYGYELLHRATSETETADDDGDRMSSDMLLKAFWEIGIPQVRGKHRSFFNMTRNILMNRCLDTLPAEGVVLEVLEDVPADRELLERIANLRRRKFEIALDDFTYQPEREALIGLADIVKLDCLAMDEASLRRHVELLKVHGVCLLAEKVETREMHERTMDLGFDLFQGYYFARPHVQTSRRILPNKVVLLELLARVNEPDITPEDLGTIIRGDVWLSITVLRWANAPINGLRRAVDSVERAIIVLGSGTIRNWVALLAMARMGSAPTELLTMLLARARTCELLASETRRPNPPGFFTVGLLSALDVILQTDMAHALEFIPLADAQKAALLSQAGEYGAALQSVIALESGDRLGAKFQNLSAAEVTQCYLSALAWADNLGGDGV